VRRQIDWLTAAGWTVDTVGVGDGQVRGVRRHYPIHPPRRWTLTPFGTVALYLLSSRAMRFRRLVTDGIDRALHEDIRRGVYDLFVFNDHHLMPWVKDRRVFTAAALAARIHADVHEYFPPRYSRRTWWARITGPHHDWVRSLIGDPMFTTRSVVVDEIADLYESEFQIPRPEVIMSAPAFAELEPTPVHTPIRLVHHGKSELTRGLVELVDAVGVLDDRFELTMYLVGGEAVADALRERARPFSDRVTILPAVPYDDLCATLNQHDVEVAFFPPTTKNLELAMPNKLFEAIQARLGMIIGETAPMVRIVEKYQVGGIARGWSADALADALSTITPEDVSRWKAATTHAARDLNAEAEGRRFLQIIGGDGDEG